MITKGKNAMLIISIILLFLGALSRLLPHPANFAPITAIAMFGGLYLPRRMAFVVPLAAMLIGDVFIGFYSLPIMASVYGSFLLAGAIGLWVKKRKSFATVLGGTLLSSILFFLITNAAVWAFGAMYPPTLSGLFESYTMGLPFFRNSALGDLVYTGIMVGGMETVRYAYAKQKSESLGVTH